MNRSNLLSFDAVTNDKHTSHPHISRHFRQKERQNANRSFLKLQSSNYGIKLTNNETKKSEESASLLQSNIILFFQQKIASV